MVGGCLRCLLKVVGGMEDALVLFSVFCLFPRLTVAVSRKYAFFIGVCIRVWFEYKSVIFGEF